MPEKFNKGQSRILRGVKLCPHCGHDDFSAIPTRFSWLFGQRFICAKCKGTFRKANLVRVRQKDYENVTKQSGRSRWFKRNRNKHH
jgi:transposase-like protein